MVLLPQDSNQPGFVVPYSDNNDHQKNFHHLDETDDVVSISSSMADNDDDLFDLVHV